MKQIIMPKLSDSMEEGTIVQWLKKAGDPVEKGEIIVEVESDKAVMELEAFYSGTLGRIIHGDGDEVKVGEAIGEIEESGLRAAASEEKKNEAEEQGEKIEQPGASVTATVSEPEDQEAKPVSAPLVSVSAEGRVAASPYARRLAAERGIDLASIKGTGPGGRIVAADVHGMSKEPTSTPKPAPKPAKAGTADLELPPISFAPEEADSEPATSWQLAAARRVVASKHVIPHFYVTKLINATSLLAEKEEHKPQFRASIGNMITRASAMALQKFPQVNWSYDRGKIIKWKVINVGIAIQAEKGLVVGVLKDADKMALPEIGEKTRDLAVRARANKLKPVERRNPTFTISNLGMFDVDSFQAIINPPSSCTLAVSSCVKAPAVVKGGLVVGDLMRLTLSADHRAVDGATAALFLGEIKRLLEDPHELFPA